jgi:hypothetical protein
MKKTLALFALMTALAILPALAQPAPGSLPGSLVDQEVKLYAVGGGTAQAQTVTLSPSPSALTAGLVIRWLPVAANTSAAPTLAVNTLTAKTITKCGTSALVANDLTLAAVAEAIYDGTRFQLRNPQVTSCASNGVLASAPGAGLAHFAGSTQTVTSSAVNLAGGSTEVTGVLPNSNTTGTAAATVSTLVARDAAGATSLSPGGNFPVSAKYTVTKIAANAIVSTGTYTSGITATGTVGQTCTLTSLNGGGSAAAATVALTGTNTIAGGTALVITAAGTGYSSAPTSATAGNGTATCSGTATISTVITGTCQTAKGCWQVNTGTPVATTTAATNVITWLAAPANAVLDRVRLKTAVACAGLTTITITQLGTTASATEFLAAATYDLMAAVTATNLLWPAIATPGLTAAGTNWTVTVATATGAEKVDDITNGCSFDINARWSVLP